MHIYFSGIGGVGIGPLARIALDLGYNVSASDSEQNQYVDSFTNTTIDIAITTNDNHISETHKQVPIDWFVHTAALPENHAELEFARAHDIKIGKRDDFINHLLKDKNLKMVAVAGTHGKTNTTGILIWCLKQLGINISYAIGTNISYGPNGLYEPESEYFIYEADEYDKNFLKYEVDSAIITSADYDHPDTYPTIQDYKLAFMEFSANSNQVITWQSVANYLNLQKNPQISLLLERDDKNLSEISLVGEMTRRNAWLVKILILKLLPDLDERKVIEAINTFPGTQRRMEFLAENIISDYAHHPIEIASAVKAALEHGKPVVAVYQPHQNLRQMEIQADYANAFSGVDKVVWLPTYLSREPQNQEVIPPQQLASNIDGTLVELAEINDQLWQTIQDLSKSNTVLLMSAGDLDLWARTQLQDNK